MLVDPQLTVTSLGLVTKLLVQLLNAFFDPLSHKALGFIALTIASVTYLISNYSHNKVARLEIVQVPAA
jgi:hypothetical protein